MVGKTRLLIIFGALTVVLPIVGIPRGVKDICFFVLGGLVIGTAVQVRRSTHVLKLKLKRLEGQQGTLVS